MSYPDPQYLGDRGEVSAVYRPAGEEPDLRVGPSAAHYIATGASTKGRFGLYRWDMVPGTPGAAAHFHLTISESFFILSGTVGLFNGEIGPRRQRGTFSPCQRAEYTASVTSPVSPHQC